MEVFIRVASEMCNRILDNDRVESSNKEAFSLKLKNFHLFLEEYA